MSEICLDSIKKIYCVGIKGTGLSAAAAFLSLKGFDISGSDTAEKFPTEDLLDKYGIRYYEDSDPERINGKTDLIIYSTAYDPETHPELKTAREKGIPLITYPEILGLLSKDSFAVGISGVNGKTSMTAICASAAWACSLDFSAICGSGMNAFDGNSFINNGGSIFIAETCEYKNSFLNFSPDVILVTNIELDHTDFFKNINEMKESFFRYIKKLPPDGTLIYCADDPVLNDFIKSARPEFPSVRFIQYGFKAEGEFRISGYQSGNGYQSFRLDICDDFFTIKVPGKHNAINAAGAAAVVCRLLEREGRLCPDEIRKIRKGIGEFSGTKRRTEVYGEASGIIFMDDYGHHPTAIKKTLSGLRDFYPGRRIVIDFMSHTYTRTEAFIDEFAASFDDAGLIVLNKIYASARENRGNIDGKTLYEKTKAVYSNTVYCPEFEDAGEFLKKNLKSGDLFITMGAGDNWKLCRDLYNYFRSN